MSFILGTVPTWISNSFPVFERICLVILALLAITLIVLVFMQITGGSETNIHRISLVQEKDVSLD